MMALTSDERELLSEIVARRAPEARSELGRVLRGERLTIEEANVLRDAAGLELAETGVDHMAGAINDRGRTLDRLIDLIARQSELHGE